MCSDGWGDVASLGFCAMVMMGMFSGVVCVRCGVFHVTGSVSAGISVHVCEPLRLVRFVLEFVITDLPLEAVHVVVVVVVTRSSSLLLSRLLLSSVGVSLSLRNVGVAGYVIVRGGTAALEGVS